MALVLMRWCRRAQFAPQQSGIPAKRPPRGRKAPIHTGALPPGRAFPHPTARTVLLPGREAVTPAPDAKGAGVHEPVQLLAGCSRTGCGRHACVSRAGRGGSLAQHARALYSGGFLRVNCAYPGAWKGGLERVEYAGDVAICVVLVQSADDAQSLHAVSFLRLHGDRIVQIDEYWSDDGPVPPWRTKLLAGGLAAKQPKRPEV